jgi:hypothetical protein
MDRIGSRRKNIKHREPPPDLYGWSRRKYIKMDRIEGRRVFYITKFFLFFTSTGCMATLQQVAH